MTVITIINVINENPLFFKKPKIFFIGIKIKWLCKIQITFKRSTTGSRLQHRWGEISRGISGSAISLRRCLGRGIG